MKNQNKFLFTLFIAIFTFLSFAADTSAQKSGPGYHLLTTIAVGGDTFWDGLIADPDAHRLYVSHGTHVVVIDTGSDKVVGDIPGTNGVHCIAVAEKLGRGFTSNGRDNTVTIFDLKTLKVLGTVPTGKNPDAITYDPASKRVFAFNGGSSNVTVIDAADGKVAGTIDLGGKPEFATSDGKGTVFVNIEDKSQVVAIDSIKMTVRSRWAVAPGEEPSGIALDSKTMRLFMVCGNKKMIVMDAVSGKIITDLPTGDGTDGAEFDPGMKYAFASNGEGTLTVVHEDSKDKFSIAENVKTQPRARTLAIDTKTHKVYLPTAQFGTAPAATTAQPRPRAPMIPGTFVVLVYGK